MANEDPPIGAEILVVISARQDDGPNITDAYPAAVVVDMGQPWPEPTFRWMLAPGVRPRGWPQADKGEWIDGVTQVAREGVTWARGRDPETKTALLAAYALADHTREWRTV